jgi:hypothetical protein
VIRIPLQNGLVALIDDEDAEWADLPWFATRGRGAHTMYARRHCPRDDGRDTTRLLHRDILGVPPGVHVDHVNGDGLDNRRANLRLCTHEDNMRNRRPRPGQFKGVRPSPRGGQGWTARIQIGGKGLHLGTFETAEAAARAYDAAARRFFGEFARPNFPGES